MTVEKDKILRTLQAMKPSELKAMAAKFDPPIETKKTWSGKKLARAIRKRQLIEEAKIKKVVDKIDKATHDKNPEFEAALNVPDIPDEIPQETRGGKREGAGRPEGSTTEKMAIKKLGDIKIPNAAIKAMCVGTFTGWAWLTKVPQIRLNDEEANFLSLPLTKIQEYFWPGLVPEILGVIGEAMFAFVVVTKTRIDLINALRQAKKDGVNVPKNIDEIDPRLN